MSMSYPLKEQEVRTPTIAAVLLGCIPLMQACASSQASKPQDSPSATVKPKQSNPSAPDEDKKAAIDQANQYARDGLYREAVSSFKKYLSENPKDPAAHRTLGIIYVKSGAYKQALTHLQEAFPAYADNFELNYYIAEALRTQGRYADAIYHYKRALSADPKSLPALKALTWSYYNIRFYTEALKSARLLRKMDPNDFQISIIQARVMNKIGMNDRALTLLNKAEALASPEEIPYLFSVKGDIFLELKQSEKAEQAYRQALQDQPLLPGALSGLAKKFLRDGKNIPQAISYLERALRIRPQHTEAYYLLGQAYAKTDAKKSEEYLRRFYKEAIYDPLFQQEIASLRQRFSDEDKDNKSETARGTNGRAEELEDQL